MRRRARPPRAFEKAGGDSPGGTDRSRRGHALRRPSRRTPRQERPSSLSAARLKGSSSSVYAQGILGLAARAGLRAAVLNFRYCARDPLDLDRCIPNDRPRLYHSGETSDFDFVARTLAATEGRPLLVAGVSLGGNVLLKWLGENPGDPIVAAAATLSVPFDLAAGDRYMARFPSNLYVRTFVKTLTAKAENLGHGGSPRRKGASTFRAHAARSRSASSTTRPRHPSRLHRRGATITPARAPCPSSPGSPCPRSVSRPSTIRSYRPKRSHVRAPAASEAVRFVVTAELGGHVGFVAADGFSPAYWAEALVVDFLARREGGVRGTYGCFPGKKPQKRAPTETWKKRGVW